MRQSVLEFSRQAPLVGAKWLRLGRGPDDRKNSLDYLERSRQNMVFEAAAAAWARGVPWAESLEIASGALQSASLKLKPLPKGKAKGQAKAKRKSAAQARS